MTRVVGPRGLPPEPRAADEPVRAGRPDRPRAATSTGGRRRGTPRACCRPSPRSRRRSSGCWPGRGCGRGASPCAKAARPRAAAGSLLFVLGLLWGEAAPPWLLFPVNKNLWSPSFVLLTGGPRRRRSSASRGGSWTCAACRGWTGPFVTYGKNAIAVYVGSEVLAGALGTIAWALGRGAVRASRSASTRRPSRAGSRPCSQPSRSPSRTSSSGGRSPGGWTAGGSTSRSERREARVTAATSPPSRGRGARRRPPPSSPRACSARPRGSSGC